VRWCKANVTTSPPRKLTTAYNAPVHSDRGILMRALPLLLFTAVAASAADPKLVAKPDAFETLVNPNCSHCIDEAKRRKDELKDSDPVLMWTRGKYDGGAIPFRFFLNPYRVISDTYGVFVYDPDAGYARGFKASLDFRFHGWRNGIMVMSHKDGTLYSCLSGIAFDGPMKGTRLESWPTMVTNWGWVMKNYPNTVAYHMFEKYKPTELPTKPNEDSLRSRGEVDKRLLAEEIVLGVHIGARANPRAYRLADLDRMGTFAALKDRYECGNTAVILWDRATRTATAYRLTAYKRAETKELSREGEALELRKDLEIVADGKSETAPFLETKTGTRFDMAGRGVEGELKGWTLSPTDESLVAKWYAWSAEFPQTTVYQAKDPAPPPKSPKTSLPVLTDPKDAIREVAGTAEFLRNTPKYAATFKGYDAKAGTVTLLIEGEKVAKPWPLLPDAEIKVNGWWGRPAQFKDGDRVWVWFACDRTKQPRAVLMMCDDVTEKDIHGKAAELPKDFNDRRAKQVAELSRLWADEGLPGTITFAHIAGEVEVTLDHEGMRWGRSLKAGNTVELEDLGSRPTDSKLSTILNAPFVIATLTNRGGELQLGKLADAKPLQPMPEAVRVKAVVKEVKPWRERTRVTLVINDLDIAPFESGKRTYLKMPPPPKDVQDSDYPPDIRRKRTKEERIEWFLASIYCTCKVGNDICTGDFYTLSSCNPNGCGMPNATRKRIAAMIDKGMDDMQIFDDLRAERGPLMSKPHLLK
jgi:hypothetical protein